MRVEGAIAVKACINNHKREVKQIFIDSAKKTKDFNYIRKIARENDIEMKETDTASFSDISSGRSHGGIIAEVGERNYDEFNDGDVFFPDGIEDPFNLAYILRTLYAFGIRNVLLPDKDYSSMEAQLLKSSAGAYEMLNIRISKDPVNDVRSLKEKGYITYALKRGDDATDIFNEVFAPKSLFLLGGEKRGISAALIEECDKYLYIPYGSDFRNSLNASAAADVVATLLFAQRK
ncbi:MAG: hypothetical protein IJJ00_04220 [Erysipelotrichaceae bacterium]|nr:hypothetical protein [Erysipelotrichaceae bacterium]